MPRQHYDYEDDLRGDPRGRYGNVTQDTVSAKLFWFFMAIFASLGLAIAAWAGNSIVDIDQRMAKLETKVDLLLEGRYERRP